jgi:outer membrane receptor protein involved in Fe transport
MCAGEPSVGDARPASLADRSRTRRAAPQANAGAARSQGAEIDVNARVTDGLTVELSGTPGGIEFMR